MELGKKLRAARQEAGLSQRELCGDQITRNMLSQIENGAARPSMDTLQYLAGRLGKSVSFFLEDGAIDPEQRRMEQARAAFGAEKFEQVLEQLADRPINLATDWEAELLVAMACLGAAEQAVEQGRLPYAQQLLDRAGAVNTPYFGAALERQRLVLLARIRKGVTLPSDDSALLVRAENALEGQRFDRAACYLDAAENRDGAQWNLLRGRTYLAQQAYGPARDCFLQAESRYPKDCAAGLEVCCRELGDYQGAYLYACKLRELGGK